MNGVPSSAWARISGYKSAARVRAPLRGNPCPLIYIPDKK